MTSADFILMEPADAPGTGGGSWSDQETLLLLEALELYGENWNEIAEHVATKTKTQCILHFVKMPIEDRFLTNDLDLDEKNIPENDENAPEISNNEDKKENEDSKTEHAEEGKLLSALRTAFMTYGSGLKEGELSSFADAGNPAMALVGNLVFIFYIFSVTTHNFMESHFLSKWSRQAAFLVALVDHDPALISSRSSLSAMTEESSGIQLAARHCYVLEDPPKQQGVEQDSGR